MGVSDGRGPGLGPGAPAGVLHEVLGQLVERRGRPGRASSCPLGHQARKRGVINLNNTGGKYETVLSSQIWTWKKMVLFFQKWGTPLPGGEFYVNHTYHANN